MTAAETLLAVVCDLTAPTERRLACAAALWTMRGELSTGLLRDLGDAVEQIGGEAHDEALERCHVYHDEGGLRDAR